MFLMLGLGCSLIGIVAGVLYAAGEISDSNYNRLASHSCIAMLVFIAIHFLFNGA